MVLIFLIARSLNLWQKSWRGFGSEEEEKEAEEKKGETKFWRHQIRFCI